MTCDASRRRLCVVTTTPLIVHFFLKRHLRELAQKFDVTLVVNPQNDAYLVPLDLPVKMVGVTLARRIAPLADLRALIQLVSLFRRQKYDLVLSLAPKAGLLAMIAAVLARVQCRVHVFQGEVWASKRGMIRSLLRAMDRLTALLATHLLAVSLSEKRFLESEKVAPTGKVVVLGKGSISGVDLKRFVADPSARAQVRSMFRIPETDVVCLYLGRLTADKGIYDLSRAFNMAAARTRSRLWLIMVGPDEDGAAERIRELSGDARARLVIVGYTDTPERFVAAADLLCLPSYREGFGMVIIEAAAAGVPAIGTRIYGVADALIDGETGILVPVGDVRELATQLCRLADDKRLREGMGRAARIRVEQDFEQAMVVGRFVHFLENLLVSKPVRSEA